jgi:hypothetical protein
MSGNHSIPELRLGVAALGGALQGRRQQAGADKGAAAAAIKEPPDTCLKQRIPKLAGKKTVQHGIHPGQNKKSGPKDHELLQGVALGSDELR